MAHCDLSHTVFIIGWICRMVFITGTGQGSEARTSCIVSWVRSTLDLQRMYGSLTSLIMKQQQQKIHGMEIELAPAKNAVEQHVKGNAFIVWFLHASVLIQVSLGPVRLPLGYIILAARQRCH